MKRFVEEPDMSLNPWRELGVHRGSTQAEIKDAYYDQMRKHHPDVGGAQAKAAELTHCYRVLTNAVVLKSYLDTLNVLGTPCIKCNGRGYKSKQQGFTASTKTQCDTCGGRGLLVKGGL